MTAPNGPEANLGAAISESIGREGAFEPGDVRIELHIQARQCGEDCRFGREEGRIRREGFWADVSGEKIRLISSNQIR